MEYTDVERWVANYSVRQNSNIPRNVWQCCCTGRVSGINENVDINFGYKDYTKIITPRTEPVSSYGRKDTWVKDSIGWWYSYATGGYPANRWEYIGNAWYHFDSSGYMQTGWQYIGSYCYYLQPNGAMASDTWIGEYYVDSSGAWVPGKYRERWVQSGDRWWYQYSDGSYAIGWKSINGIWYYFDSHGWMQTGVYSVPSEPLARSN